MMHLTQLGIEVLYNGEPDGGQLFVTACVTFLLSAIILFMHRKQIPIIGNKFNIN